MDLTYCPQLEGMVRSRSTVGESGRVFQGLGALSSLNNLAVLRSVMLQQKPLRTLEVGLSFGGSALAIASSHRDLGQPPEQQHVALDPYQQSVWDNAGLMAIRSAGLDGYVDFRPQLSANGLARLLDEGRQFDLIYVDGSHQFDDVFVDAYFAFRLAADHGLVFFDDCSTSHVAKVLSYVSANWSDWTHEWDLTAFHPEGGSVRHRIGRRLGRIQLRAFERRGTDTRAWDTPLKRF
jgi:cephalosporin hydroxylase